MRFATLVRPAMTGLALSLVVLCAGCDDEERVDLILGSELSVVSAPNPVHTVIDSEGKSVITVTVSSRVDLVLVPLIDEPVELETTVGSLVPTMGVTGDTDPNIGKFTSTFKTSTVGFATVTVRANEQEVFYLIEVTDREPEASTPSQTHLMDPASATITACEDAPGSGTPIELTVQGRLQDVQFFAMQGGTVDVSIRPTTDIPAGGWTFENGATSISVVTGGSGLYEAKLKLDKTACEMSCVGMPDLCSVSVFGSFTGSQVYESDVNVNDAMLNDLEVTTNIP